MALLLRVSLHARRPAERERCVDVPLELSVGAEKEGGVRGEGERIVSGEGATTGQAIGYNGPVDVAHRSEYIIRFFFSSEKPTDRGPHGKRYIFLQVQCGTGRVSGRFGQS